MDNYYTNIKELPLFNWIECQSGDLTFTRRKKSKGNIAFDKLAWESLYDSYIAKFGLSNDSEDYYRKMQELTDLYKEYAATGDEFIFNQIDLILDEISSLQKHSKFTIDDAIAQLSEHMKVIIDPKTITTIQFFILQENMKKKIERLNQENKK